MTELSRSFKPIGSGDDMSYHQIPIKLDNRSERERHGIRYGRLPPHILEPLLADVDLLNRETDTIRRIIALIFIENEANC